MPEILYRKWRPRSFSELAGQDHVTTTLTNALALGRIAHAYVFAGPRGTGKTTTGRLLAKALNCPQRVDGEACNGCESCLSFLAGRAMDLIEMDAASNRGIEEIRSLREKVAFAPGAGEYKVYLIDEVHMLTEAAFNALLKTLEEPPPHVVFILATTDPHKVPATILSRCQRLDFRRAPLAASVANLERICEGEGIICEPAALELIARSATGSHRDAVNLLDQLATSYGNDLSLEHVRTGLGLIGDERSGRLAHSAIEGDLASGLEIIASVRDDGLDLRQFQRELVAELRSLLMVKSGLSADQTGVPDERRRELQASVANVPASRLLLALRAFGEADLKLDPNSTLPLDIALAECVLDASQPGGSQAGPSGNQASGQDAGVPVAAPARQPQSNRHPQRVEGRSTPAPEGGSAGIPAAAQPDEQLVTAAVASVDRLTAAAGTSPLTKQTPAFASGETLALADAQLLIRPIYEALRSRPASRLLSAMLGVGDIIDVNQEAVVFGFKFADHAKKAMDKGNLEMLTAVVAETFGRPMSVRCVESQAVRDWLQMEQHRSALVRAAQELGARVISPDPEGPA